MFFEIRGTDGYFILELAVPSFWAKIFIIMCYGMMSMEAFDPKFYLFIYLLLLY
jgi:hypothetical protein